jgi:hypothetical protein
MIDNPDPRKYVIKIRRGKAILVDKQILRWRKKRKEAAAKAEKVEQIEATVEQLTERSWKKFFE